MINRLETWDLDCRSQRNPDAWYEENSFPILTDDNIEKIVSKINEIIDVINVDSDD